MRVGEKIFSEVILLCNSGLVWRLGWCKARWVENSIVFNFVLSEI